MSLIKGKQEFRTILDFSKGNISKNMIKRALREVEVHELVRLQDTNTYTFVENDIIVGMYQIRLFFSSVNSASHRSRLREYGGFRIAIYERNRKAGKPESPKGAVLQHINLSSDKRFKHQYWVDLNKDYSIRMKNLVDIIMHLNRLNNLKMFL